MIKKLGSNITAILLSVAMVFTMMPLTGVGVQTASAAESGDGGTVASNSDADAKAAFGESNVTVSKSGSTLTIKLEKDIELGNPVKFVKGSSGDILVLDLNGHDIIGANGASSNANESTAKGKDAIQIIANEFNIEITDTSAGNKGSVIGGDGTVYALDLGEAGSMKYAGNGGMAVSFADSNWKPTASNGKLTYGLTVTGGITIKGGDGADISGEEWIYNINNYSGGHRYSAMSYDNPMFRLKAGEGAPAIGQTGKNVSEGLSDNAYAKIIVDNGIVSGGSGGKVNLNTSSMPVLTHYALMHNDVIKGFLDEVDKEDAYSNYFANQLKFLPGNGGDGIVIGEGRKFVYVAPSGTIEGGSSGNFDYGQSKLVNQYDSIGAGNTARSGNGLSVYGDVGLTSVSPSDSSVTLDNTASFTKDSNEMGIYIAGTVKGGASPDATAMNEYSGDGGEGIALDGMYGRFDWGIVEVDSEGSVYGGNSGSAAYGAVGVSGDAIREYTPKGTEPFNTRFGTDYYIINGIVKGGNGGDSLGLTSAGAGSKGMTFDLYRTGLRIYGDGSVVGGDYGNEINHGQQVDTERTNAIRTGSNPGVIDISQTKGNPVTINDVDKLNIEVTMSAFESNPTTSTTLNVSGIPQGYTGNIFIAWGATIYETSSSQYGSYRIESSGSNLTSFNLLNNQSYGGWNSSDNAGYLSYPTYPGHSSIQLDMNLYNAPVATVNRMKEDDKYQTDIYCRVVLADGRWGKSDIMRFEKNGGWDGTGYVTEDEGSGGSSADQQEMEEALAVGKAIKALPSPGNVTEANNADIVDAYDRYYRLTAEQIQNYLYDYDYGAKIDACFAALSAIVGADDNELVETINAILGDLPDNVDELTLDDEASVKAAQAAYNNLSAEKKAEFDAGDTKAKLDAAIAKIDTLRTAADAAGCRHGNIEKIAAKPSTCHTKGNISHYRCVACGALFSDRNGENEITAESVETALNENAHEYGEWVTETAPTCKYTGTKKRTCKYHSTVWQSEDIPVDPKAHNWSDWAVTTQPTCTAAGVKKRTCQICNETETEVINKIAHTWDGGVVTKQPAVGVAGERTYTCTVCGEIRTEAIDALPQPQVTPAAPAEICDLPAVKVSKPKAAKKKLTAKWKKVSKKNQKKIAGIEIQVKGPGVNKTVTAGKKKTSKKIKGLKSKKKYSVRVRAYKWAGGKKHVSKWSKWKTAKVK